MEIVPEKKATEAANDENDGEGKDVSSMEEENDPWNPPYPPYAPSPCKDLAGCIKSIKEWRSQKRALLAASRAIHTIIPDRTPESINDAFFDKLPCLVPILEKDSVRRFLSFFRHYTLGLAYGYVITPLTFNQMVEQNALRCAKVALEGKAPELYGHRANPNYMNVSGYFPLHEAAETFSADMIKLLFRYGASANLRTAGPEVIEGLLPLHVAVENTCRHKFLEDNMLPDKENSDYVYRLIQLICLPEMKIFLDTVRLIAERTDDLLAELWKYIKDGKLAEAAVLLLAAQKKIRTAGSSFKANGNLCTTDGFSIISNLCTEDVLAIDSEISAQNRARKKKQQLKVEKKLRRMALLLVFAISEAGEALDLYIRAHPEVPRAMQVSHVEVLERVSSILKNYGFFPTGQCINIGNLCPYEQQSYRLSDDELPDKLAAAAARKKQQRRRGWELEHTRRSFFEDGKSVLKSHWVSPAPEKLLSIRETEEILAAAAAAAAAQGSSSSPPVPNNTTTNNNNNNLGLSGRIFQPLTRCSNQQQQFSRRLFGTAASTALKLLKHA